MIAGCLLSTLTRRITGAAHGSVKKGKFGRDGVMLRKAQPTGCRRGSFVGPWSLDPVIALALTQQWRVFTSIHSHMRCGCRHLESAQGRITERRLRTPTVDVCSLLSPSGTVTPCHSLVNSVSGGNTVGPSMGLRLYLSVYTVTGLDCVEQVDCSPFA